MAESINGLIWILERLHLTPSPAALRLLFGLGVLSFVIAPVSYIIKRLRTAQAKKGNIVPAIGMIVCVVAFAVFLVWDLKANGEMKPENENPLPVSLPAGKGGDAGDARVEYGEGDAKGGKGGKGGAPGGGAGGKGGGATVIGGKGSALAGDGGNAGQNPGDGGQGGQSAWPKMVAADPLLQRVDLAQRLTEEYKTRFGAADGSEAWINDRLKERGERWHVKVTATGFNIIDAPAAN